MFAAYRKNSWWDYILMGSATIGLSIPTFTLGLLLILLAIDSLSWHIEELDTPLLLYIAHLVDRHGYVFYRDIFDWQLPSAPYLGIIVGRLIPAGTGSVMNRLRAVAAGRDKARGVQQEGMPALPGQSIAAE